MKIVKIRKLFVFTLTSILILPLVILPSIFVTAKTYSFPDTSSEFLPVYVKTALSEGITEDFSKHWQNNADGSVQRINDNGAALDSAESQASLYLKNNVVKYFEMKGFIKLGDISGLTGFLFGTWNINCRFTGGSEAFYITKDKKVGFWGSHLGGPGGGLESGIISNISLTEYNVVSLRVEKNRLCVTINGEKAFEKNVSESSIFEGRLGIFTTKANSCFKDITINELNENGEVIQDTVKKTVENIAFDNEELTVNLVDNDIFLKYTITPSDVYNKKVFFCIENPDIAGINNEGKLTLYSAGLTTVYIYTEDGMLSDKLFLTVEEEEIIMKALSLNLDSLTMKKDETTSLIAIIEPADLENYTLRWSSSDTGVVMVNNGKLTAVGTGEAVITLRDSNRKFEVKCNVSVTDKEESSGCSNNSKSVIPLMLIILAAALIMGGNKYKNEKN